MSITGPPNKEVLTDQILYTLKEKQNIFHKMVWYAYLKGAETHAAAFWFPYM